MRTLSESAADSRGAHYSMEGVYFSRGLFRTTADCMTAAYAQRLPLQLCK